MKLFPIATLPANIEQLLIALSSDDVFMVVITLDDPHAAEPIAVLGNTKLLVKADGLIYHWIVDSLIVGMPLEAIGKILRAKCRNSVVRESLGSTSRRSYTSRRDCFAAMYCTGYQLYELAFWQTGSSPEVDDDENRVISAL